MLHTGIMITPEALSLNKNFNESELNAKKISQIQSGIHSPHQYLKSARDHNFFQLAFPIRFPVCIAGLNCTEFQSTPA